MHPQDESRSLAAKSGATRSDAIASNPIRVVGSIAAKDLAAARSEALQPFHLGLDEADRNLHALLPATWRKGPGRPSSRFIVTDESPALDHVQAGPAGPIDAVASPTFELWTPWYVDAADAVGQPA